MYRLYILFNQYQLIRKKKAHKKPYLVAFLVFLFFCSELPTSPKNTENRKLLQANKMSVFFVNQNVN
jgi:hypothetical protein